MLNDKASSQDTIGAMLTRAAGADGHAKAGGVFTIECRDSEGNLKWSEALHNLVVNVGLQDMNTQYFKGSSYTAAWYIGLYGAAASNNRMSFIVHLQSIGHLMSRRDRLHDRHRIGRLFVCSGRRLCEVIMRIIWR